MNKKGGNFFEEHIEKIVLGVVGLVCIWLVITRVLIGPSVVSYDGKKFGTGKIDIYISEQAELLKDRLYRKPEPRQAYKPRLDDFIALVDSAISDVDVSLYLPQPNSSEEAGIRPVYVLPRIGEVEDVEVEHIRAVAYVPTEKINEENVYEEAGNEVNDLDFVTVEAKFDVSQLYDSFYGSFAGDDVREEWRDPCLANPIFAAVQLQRQELLADGGWSEWQIVPRAKIDARRGMFEVIEDAEKLPAGGIKVRLLQFDDTQVQVDMLQPEVYRIASAKQEWFPPSLHKRFEKLQSDLEAQEKHEAKVLEREEWERGREEARAERGGRTPRTRVRPRAEDSGSAGRYDGDDSGSMPAKRVVPTRRSRSERLSERERPERRGREVLSKQTLINDIYKEFSEILITAESDFTNLHEPLVFWAHDDTVEPEKRYRYRIRLGVFNPIAGTNQFSEQDKHLKNKVVLWSRFSDTTETVGIPGMLYFFPREIQEAAKTVTVQVSRYVLGRWYSKDFMVKQGEVVGKVVKSETGRAEEDVTVRETIDYFTGAVLVDVIPVNDWSGMKNLRARHYSDMLYSFDGTNIERVPIKTRYWAEKLQAKFNEIRRSEREPKEPLREWGARAGQRRRGPRPVTEEYDDAPDMGSW